MKQRPSAMIWAAIYALTMPLALGVVALWDQLKAIDQPAAWVQAFGSVGAIVGAACVASAQSREAMAREERARAQAASEEAEERASDRATAGALLDFVMALLRAGRRAVDGKSGPALLSEVEGLSVQFEALERRGMTFPLERLKNQALVATFSAALMQLSLARALCEQVARMSPKELGPDAGSAAAEQFESCVTMCSLAQLQFECERKRLQPS